jgi:hypothetical protein
MESHATEPAAEPTALALAETAAATRVLRIPSR